MSLYKFESFNRKEYRKWEESDTREDLNPAFILKGTSIEMLSKIAKGEIDVKELAKRELENLGMNIEGRWSGFGQEIK